jgi:long-chain fatty acid transport protein
VRPAFYLFVIAIALSTSSSVFGQTYGIELHNSLMPASSGMGGASFTQPQDIQSAIYGNPATLTRIDGTQFSFGGGWAEPTVNVNQATPLPLIGVTPYPERGFHAAACLASGRRSH